ncbi:MAG: hypothetical protein ACI364_03275 [Coriobacteriales bacterium]
MPEGRRRRAGDSRAGGVPPDAASLFERERRASILRDIARRVAEDGPRVAVPHPGRARQFLPFAALRGYDEQVEQAEARLLRRDRRELTEEDATALSERIASLRRSDRVRLCVYDEECGDYREVTGRVDEVVVALRRLWVGGVWYAFCDLWTVDVVR